MLHTTANGVVEAESLYVFMDCLAADKNQERWEKVPVAHTCHRIQVWNNGRVLLVRRADTRRWHKCIGFTEPQKPYYVVVETTKQYRDCPNPSETFVCGPGENCLGAVESYRHVCEVSRAKAEEKWRFKCFIGKRLSRKARIVSWEEHKKSKLTRGQTPVTSRLSCQWWNKADSDVINTLFHMYNVDKATSSRQAGKWWARAIARNREALSISVYGTELEIATWRSPHVDHYPATSLVHGNLPLSELFTFEGGENGDE